MKAEERKSNGRSGKGKSKHDPLQRKRGTRQAEPSKAPVRETVISWTKTILTALVIVMVLNGLLVASFVVPTGSMQNEVMAGDFLFVNKFVYGGSSPQTIPFLNIPLPYFRLPGIREPQKGDVIVFIYPGRREQVEADQFQYYLKRCVATAGDTLEVRNKAVYINGVAQPVPENAVFLPGIDNNDGNTYPIGAGYTRDNWGPMRIPGKGDVIQLHDTNFLQWDIFIRREGHSTEKHGEVIMIDGEPATSYTVERDYCFGMGDNRDRSEDSRYWGFIPVENVIGTPMFVYWSWNPDISSGNIGDKFSSIRWDRIFKGVD